MRVVVLTIFLLAFGSFSAFAQDWDAFITAYSGANESDATDSVMSADDSLELAELTFRNLFANNKAVKPRKSKFYIISFLHCARHMYIDPDGPFMASLQDVRPKVRKTSFYYNNEKKLYGEVIFFFITEMKITGKNSAIVRGGYYQSDDACAGHLYTIRKVDGVWDIKHVVEEWVL
ncbi:hypothetical protein GC194_08450 [bacterium]|nr:hypothetical protein [bacterium]